MGRKRFQAEQIIIKLREAEDLLTKGSSSWQPSTVGTGIGGLRLCYKEKACE